MRRDRAALNELKQVSLFAACTDRQLRFIASRVSSHSVAAGETLAEERGTGRECFIITSGTAVVSVGGRKVHEIGPGECFGEVAVLDWGARTATVTATTDVVTLVCGVRELHDIIAAAPSVAFRLLASLSRRLRAADQLLRLESAR